MKNRCEFSKVIMALVMVMFFAVDILCSYILWELAANAEYAVMSSFLKLYLTFNGSVISVATGYYLWKAKNENIEKICGKKLK